MKRIAADWHASHGRVGDPDYKPPCVISDCWVEAIGKDRALCAQHELAYIARHGEPSPAVTAQGWDRMLSRNQEGDLI